MRIIVDMDGTIANLYGFPNWLERIRAHDASPYRAAAPMWDMKQLAAAIRKAQAAGISFSVVSWLSKEPHKVFDHDTRVAKREWLDQFDFPSDEIHLVKYGTPKSRYRAPNERNVLIDDNAEVRAQFSKFNNCSAIDPAKVNIVEWLERLVEE